MNFSLIAACDQEGGIGKGGVLPWRLPGELEYFHRITKQTEDPAKQNAVVMGRKTWQSIPEKRRPLPERLNCVITRESQYQVPSEVYVVSSFEACMKFLDARTDIEQVFVIGGAQLFTEVITKPACEKIYLTRIEATFGCDTFFPELPHVFSLTTQSDNISEQGIRYYYCVYSR